MKYESLLNDARIGRGALALLIVATLFLAAKFMVEVKSYAYVGTGTQASNTIYVTGEGEVFAVPDVAGIQFSVRYEGKTVADAQKVVSEKIDAALKFLKQQGVDEKDIKTISFNAYPQYQYGPKTGVRTLTGYEVFQSVNVKVRDTDKAGGILDGLAKAGITDLAGPDFAIDDDTKLQEEARKIAIADARAKAEVLARDLGVELVRVVSFTEAQGGYGYYGKNELQAANGMGSADAVVPQLPAGENRIVSNVTVTYEIR